MPIRPIVKYGDPVLARPSAPVPVVTDEIRQLVDDMVRTMYAAPGVGLAAEAQARVSRTQLDPLRSENSLVMFI